MKIRNIDFRLKPYWHKKYKLCWKLLPSSKRHVTYLFAEEFLMFHRVRMKRRSYKWARAFVDKRVIRAY